MTSIQITTGIMISEITNLNNTNKGGGPPTADAILLEDGSSYLLLETGDKILLES